MNREDIKKMIPTGYGKIIARRAGVTPKSVSRYLNSKTRHSIKIETACLEILSEITKKRNSLIKKIR